MAESQSRAGDVNVSVWYQDRGNRVVSVVGREVEYRALGGNAVTLQNVVHHEFSTLAKHSGAKVVHLHGLWSPLLHASANAARRQRCPYIVSTRGMLAGWALGHKAWKKKLAWKLYQEVDLSHADCLVASSEFERQDIANLLPGHRVEVIPNGCDPRPQTSPTREETRFLEPGFRWALALGRLHPVKGYAELIHAWASLRPTGWKLAIAGPDENGYRSKLEELIGQHQLRERVLLLGEVDDFQKWSLLDQCELFVAPSRTENFGMAIAEALQSRTPVLTTTSTPWRELQEYDCGWWVKPDVVALGQALKAASEADAEVLVGMGVRGQKLIKAVYSWDGVATRTIELYRSILSRRAR